MKICFIGTEIVPTKEGAFMGGLVNNVIRLAERLTIQGHQVTIVTSDVNATLEERMHTIKGIHIFPIRISYPYGSVLNNVEFFRKVIPAIRRLHQQEDFDIFHAHSAYSIFALVPRMLNAFINRPMIFSLYSPIPQTPLKDRPGFYQTISSRSFSRMLLAPMDRIICLSANTLNTVQNVGIDPDRLTFIPPIIDLSRFHPQVSGTEKRHELGIPETHHMILYCGNWAYWKGSDLLIEALPAILHQCPNVVLVCAWGEPYAWFDERKSALDARIKELAVTAHIRELGIVKDIEVLMAASTMFVAPFRNTDGVADQPLSILEAMACGKPVIATRVGAIPEIIEDRATGILIEPNSTHDIVEAILFLLKNSTAAAEIGQQASVFVQNQYEIDVIAARVLEVYTEAMSYSHCS
jgi:glycosyltransferase involved in cell wall biosynthesis